jgi:hypothetical protein
MRNRKYVAFGGAWFDAAWLASSLAQKKPLACWQSPVQKRGGMPNVSESRPLETISSLLRKLQMTLPLSGVLTAAYGVEGVNLRNER